ncbi:hypothetical protein [Microbacterium elymi]|uniref:hypothetical protein n=1 Tax=Microbacterium elymi TaxID=2909587 RepID=UPI00338DA511
MSALSDRIALARRAPQILAGVRDDTVALRARLDPARAAIDRLGARYADSALRQVRSNPAEAEQLIGFAEHSARVAHDRREADQREPANLALEAATEAVRRARALLDAVDNFEIEALRAESTLGAVVDDSREDLVVARTAPQTPEVGAAVERLEKALSALPPAGVTTDPFSLLTALREANAGLDAAIATARERAEHPIPSADQVRHAIDDADRQLAIVRDLIGGHRGWIGADARTRHAEAERIREELSRLVGPDAALGAREIDEDQREQALALARRAGYLAAEALAAGPARHRRGAAAGRCRLGRRTRRLGPGRPARRNGRRHGRHPRRPGHRQHPGRHLRLSTAPGGCLICRCCTRKRASGVQARQLNPCDRPRRRPRASNSRPRPGRRARAVEPLDRPRAGAPAPAPVRRPVRPPAGPPP